MGILTSIFKKQETKKKISSCNVCQSHMELNEGYALTTAQVVASKVYWDHKMVEPETMSYTTSHFKDNDQIATNMRKIIFEKTAEKDMTWLTCETCIKKFEVDLDETQQLAKEWWAGDRNHKIPNTGKANQFLSKSDYEALKDYATMEAGASLIRI